MKIKFLCAAAALATAASFSQTAFADDAAPAAAPTPEITITGDAAIVSNYKFRGIAQTDNKPTGQMAITITDKSGFYVSTWASGNTLSGGSEIDVYGGYSHTFKDGITLDGGVYGYIYPNAAYNNLFELYADASKSIGPVGVKVGVNYAPAQSYFTFYDTNSHYSMYEYAELTYSPAKLPALTLHGHFGHTGGGLDFGKSYEDYVAGVSYKYKSLTFDVSAVGTDLSTAYLGSEHRLAKSIAVFSITAGF